MNIPETVHSWLTERKGFAHCDDCIAEELTLARRQQAHRVTSALATTRDFSRFDGTCHRCGEQRLVIERR